jgi:hypothetical protein
MPTNERMIQGFNKIEFKGLALDVYMSSMTDIARSFAEKDFVIGFKKVRSDGSLTKKFATIMILRGFPALVLHIGEIQEKEGLKIQKEVDERLSFAYERNEMQINQKPHEVFIRLDAIREIEDITSLIDLAYLKRV